MSDFTYGGAVFEARVQRTDSELCPRRVREFRPKHITRGN